MLKSRSYACLSCRRLWREAFESRATRKTTNECSIGLKQKENDSTVLLLHWYRNVSYGPLCLFSGTVLLCPVSKQYQSNIRRQTGRMSSTSALPSPLSFLWARVIKYRYGILTTPSHHLVRIHIHNRKETRYFYPLFPSFPLSSRPS